MVESQSNRPADSNSYLADSMYYTSMAHFYRGELGRIMTWRKRLDATTNWAIAAATGLITFSLGRPEVTHLVFIFGNLIVFLLLCIEARRYRYYDAFRGRVRMLEAHFLVPVVTRNTKLLQGDWRNLLVQDLVLPSYKINRREAISRRMVRSYIWMFLMILCAWALKIYIHYGPTENVTEFLLAAQVNQPLWPPLFWGMVAAFYSVLLYFVIYELAVKESSSEFKRHDLRRWKL